MNPIIHCFLHTCPIHHPLEMFPPSAVHKPIQTCRAILCFPPLPMYPVSCKGSFGGFLLVKEHVFITWRYVSTVHRCISTPVLTKLLVQIYVNLCTIWLENGTRILLPNPFQEVINPVNVATSPADLPRLGGPDSCCAMGHCGIPLVLLQCTLLLAARDPIVIAIRESQLPVGVQAQ